MPVPQSSGGKAVPITLEDVAHLADARRELPDDTARRLRELILCDDRKRVRATWRLIESHREELGQMAVDAEVDLWVDAIYVFRIFERLRSEDWRRAEDLVHRRVDVPYRELISMARAYARRASGAERTDLNHLTERLTIGLSRELRDEPFMNHLIDRMVEAGEETAEEMLSQFMGLYQRRRKMAGG